MRSLFVLSLGLLLGASTFAQEPGADGDLLSLGEKLLGQAKARYERKDWFEAMELAERSRTAFLALSELYASQNRSAEVRKLGERVTECNQLVRLVRDARKAEQDKAAPKIDPVAKKPDLPAPTKDPAPLPDLIPKVPEKPLPPEAETQEKALKTIREVFQADYAKTSLADRQALARKLLKEAMATKGDRTAQFVLFRQAIELAAQGGDLGTAFEAIEAVGREFAVDPLALKVATLSKNPPATTHELAGPAVEGCLRVAEDAIRRDHYDLATFVLKKADAITRTPINVTLQARVQARAKEVTELQSARETLKAAEKSLADKPGDAEASLQVGKFQCFMKGDWETGLPMLRGSSDGDLRKLAETELTPSPNADLKLDLADAWWSLAEKESSVVAKANLKVRARLWYGQALSGLNGFPKTRVETRLQDMDEDEKSRWSVNLLKLIDPKKDGVKGDWTFDGKTLISPPIQWAKLQVPFAPPEEYDLTLVVSRKAGPDGLVIGLVGGGKQLYGIVDGGNATAGGLEMIDGKAWPDNETLFRTRILTDDKPRTLLWSVRKNRVTLSVNGTTFIDWKADYRRITGNSGWTVPSKKSLMLGSWITTYHFNQAWLSPISGQGQKLR